MPSVEVYSPECIREFRDKVRRQAERARVELNKLDTGGMESLSPVSRMTSTCSSTVRASWTACAGLGGHLGGKSVVQILQPDATRLSSPAERVVHCPSWRNCTWWESAMP